MVNHCPACGTTKIYETKEKLVCRECNYVHKTKYSPEDEDE